MTVSLLVLAFLVFWLMLENLAKKRKIRELEHSIHHQNIFSMNLSKKLGIYPDEYLDHLSNLDGAMEYVIAVSKAGLDKINKGLKNATQPEPGTEETRVS